MFRVLLACSFVLPGLAFCQPPAQKSPKSSTTKLLVEFSEEVGKTLQKYDTKLQGIEKDLGELHKRESLTETQKKKLDELVYERGKVVLEMEVVRKNLNTINDAIAKHGNDIEEMKKSFDLLKSEQDKLKTDAIKGRIERLEKAPEEFKAFTRMIEHRRGMRGVAESWIELEADVDGKKIPLANMKIWVFRQFKDGEPTLIQEIMTDSKGIATITEPDVRGQPGPQYVLFQFKGDYKYRACEVRTHIK